MKIRKYLSLVKFSHTVFAMPFAFIGFFLAVQLQRVPFEWTLLLKVVLCMVFARNAAMGFNRYADRNIDARNPRTSGREIPAGVIKARRALLFVIANCVGFMLTAFFINRLCFFLSPVALAVVLGYSLTKKFTALCHLILGLGLALAPIGAYLAVTGSFDLLPVLFSIAVMFWVAGFDVIYAMQDEEFDKGQGLLSIPALTGKKAALNISSALHGIAAVFLFWAGTLGDFGTLFWTGYAIFIGLLIYQHAIVKHDDLSRVNLSFFTTNGVASVVLACFAIADMYVR